MLTRNTSLFALLFAIPFALVGGDADAKYCNSGGSKAPAGRYCGDLVQRDCAPGCYCTGGGNIAGDVFGKIASGICKNRTKSDKYENAGVHLCPADFPDSPSGASAKTQCFTKSNSGAKVNYGTKVKCDAGKYLPAGETSCASCQSDSVCSGGTFDFSKKSASGLSKCTGGQVPNAKHSACETSKTSCDSGKYLPANSASCASCKSRYYLCVGGSFAKASSDQGIQKCPSGQIADYNTKTCVAEFKGITCNPGEYLPANTTTCKKCPVSITQKDSYGDEAITDFLCKGGTFEKSSEDQGAILCGLGYIAKNNQKCEPRPFFCTAGLYAPANRRTCKTCKDGHYCKGEETFVVANYDQGAVPCPEGTGPNETRTACVAGTYVCEPGTFLPANGTKCITCPTTRNYCPGGTFTTTSYDQGLKICPDKTLANTKRTACVLTLNKDQMRYGLASTPSETDEQCWTKNNMDDYIRCMFGGKMVVPYNAGPIIKSEITNSQE